MSGASRGALILQAPSACSQPELTAFESLVRQGFAGSDETLPERIRRAERLAFRRAADGSPVGIAGLEAPGERYRNEVFERANAGVDSTGWELELGWVFVVPEYRRGGIGERLCRRLLEELPGARVFATTRPHNTAMIRILGTLGFERTGRPYPHSRRDERLALFLRHAC